jgi:hypothetical protein
MRFREGYEPVHPSEVSGYELPVIDDGNHAGTVGVGGLMLTKIPKETPCNANLKREKDAGIFWSRQQIVASF